MDNRASRQRVNLPAADQAAESAHFMARARIMMIVSGLTTVLAIAAVVTVIGYRMYAGMGAGATIDDIVTLPKGARVISTLASAGRIAVLLDVGGASELRTFDIKTLKPVGRLRFANEP